MQRRVLLSCAGMAARLMICSTTDSHATGAVSHGTYYAYWFDPERIVVAIDSRQGDTRDGVTVYRDDKCKLLPLGTSGLFFAEGIIANSDPQAVLFDGFAMASKWYAQNSHFGIQMVADAWATEMADHMRNLYPAYPTLLDARHDGEIVNAHFVGFDAAGRLDEIVATVRHHTGETDFSIASRHMSFTYNLGGHREPAEEFMKGSTERAAAVKQSVLREAADKPWSQRFAIELREIVSNVPRWANDPGSGGEVAIAILEASTKMLTWFHKPSFCQ
jgi:hypothetical protein